MSSPVFNYDQGSSNGPITAIQAGVSDRTAYLAKVYSLLMVGIGAYFLFAGLPVAGFILGIPILSSIAVAGMNLSPMIALVLIIGASFGIGMIMNVKGLNLLGFFGIAGLYGFLTISLFMFVLFKFAPDTSFAADGRLIDPVGFVAPGLAVILQAFILTTVAMGGLTAYVLTTKKDFHFLRGMLWTGFAIGFGIAICAVLFSFFGAGDFLGIKFDILHLGLSFFFTILFMGFVLYDTSNILHRYRTDQVVQASTVLLIDFIILFRNILYILAASRK